jgi:5-methylcytosine-specific restriction protein B
MLDLRNSNELKDAVERVLARISTEPAHQTWLRELREFLHWVQAASPQERRGVPFQQRIWNDNAVSAVGKGNINVDDAIADKGFRAFVAALWEENLPVDPEARPARIKELFEQCIFRFQTFGNRQPWLKALRVFAVAFPRDFTTVTNRRCLFQLEAALTGRKSKHVVESNRAIIDRLDAVFPTQEDSAAEVATWMMVPWVLFEECVQQRTDDTATEQLTPGGNAKLVPRPAVSRRRGLLAIGGYLSTLRAILEFVREGCLREDLREHIRSLSPALKPSSINTIINSLIAEWGAVRASDNKLELTERADAFLDTADPSEFADWLLTRVLGVDNALAHLRQEGLVPRDALIDLIKGVNSGWTADFAPTAIIRWLEELTLVQRDEAGAYSLTEDGRRWAALVTWTPEVLPRPSVSVQVATAELKAGPAPVKSPRLDAMVEWMAPRGVFSAKTVAELHTGLWKRPVRHFAVLAGLSGSGKTLMARAYGEALAGEQTNPAAHLLTVPVQPGWYDPSPLLGYINPLNTESYQRTPFLNFLLAAAQDASRPYTVVLDEMNLSHPEQYLAPLLSAMETGDHIALHSMGEDLDGVPASIRYPSNLVLIGTVNMDETTHALSDKVLDRAYIMEFWDVDVDACPAWQKCQLSATEKNQVRGVLTGLMAALRPVKLHFGWRLIEDVLAFVGASSEAGVLSTTEALDRVVYAKLLPKLRGEDSPWMRQALQAAHEQVKRAELERSSQKLDEMLSDLTRLGSVRFWR